MCRVPSRVPVPSRAGAPRATRGRDCGRGPEDDDVVRNGGREVYKRLRVPDTGEASTNTSTTNTTKTTTLSTPIPSSPAMAATTTRKVLISAFGDVSNLAVVSAPVSAPGRGEVQVAVVYSGFSGADVNMRLGSYPMQRAAPLTPGYCFAGRVKANGPGSARFRPGDVVCAVTVYDAQSEFVNVPEKHLCPVPAGLDLPTACALSLDWSTAYGMVMRTAKVAAGQRVFVHGMSGAVGYAAMALCRLQGAVVYGTASRRNHEALRALGAHPFVYTDKAWIREMQALGGAHAVFDPLGFESFDESYAILSTAQPSRLVGYGGNLAALEGGRRRSPLPYFAKLLARNAAVWSNKATSVYSITRDDAHFQPDLAALMELAREGRVRVPIKHVWALDDIREAHESWGKLPGMGSLLVRVSDEATEDGGALH